MSLAADEQKKAELHAAIEKMPKGAVELLTPLISEFASSKKELKTIFLIRALRALITLSEKVSVDEALAAPTDYEVLLTLLQQPEAMEVLPPRDRLTEARLRGLAAKRELLKAEGGCMSSDEVAKGKDSGQGVLTSVTSEAEYHNYGKRPAS